MFGSANCKGKKIHMQSFTCMKKKTQRVLRERESYRREGEREEKVTEERNKRKNRKSEEREQRL